MLTKKDKYELTKEMLLAKYNGRCAFCGVELSNKWHIWNIEPTETFFRYDGEFVMGNDKYENKLPSCISCNTTRNNNSPDKLNRISIEQFRKAIYQEFEFLKNHSMASTYFKKAIRYGLIEETNNKIKFYFETL